MLDALPKKNYRYDPNPVPKSDLVYSSYNEIKAGRSVFKSSWRTASIQSGGIIWSFA